MLLPFLILKTNINCFEGIHTALYLLEDNLSICLSEGESWIQRLRALNEPIKSHLTHPRARTLYSHVKGLACHIHNADYFKDVVNKTQLLFTLLNCLRNTRSSDYIKFSLMVQYVKQKRYTFKSTWAYTSTQTCMLIMESCSNMTNVKILWQIQLWLTCLCTSSLTVTVIFIMKNINKMLICTILKILKMIK